MRGVKAAAKEKVRKHTQQQRESSEQTTGVNNVAEILIPQTEAGGGNFYEFEPGMYPATITNIEEVDNPFEDDKTQLEFTFEVDDCFNEDDTPATRRAWANPVWNSKSKLWGWAAAILGAEPAAGEPFRTSTLVGQKCRIVLNTGKKQDGTSIVKLTDVLGPEKPKAGKGKGSLSQRLQAGDVPAGVAVVADELPFVCVVCDEPATAYTDKGKPVCADHTP